MAALADPDWADFEPADRRITAMIRALHPVGWSVGDVGAIGQLHVEPARQDGPG